MELFLTEKIGRMNVLFFRMPQILVYVTWNQNFQRALVRLCRKESSINISCFRKSAEQLHDLTTSDFTICTQQIMEKNKQ